LIYANYEGVNFIVNNTGQNVIEKTLENNPVIFVMEKIENI